MTAMGNRSQQGPRQCEPVGGSGAALAGVCDGLRDTAQDQHGIDAEIVGALGIGLKLIADHHQIPAGGCLGSGLKQGRMGFALTHEGEIVAAGVAPRQHRLQDQGKAAGGNSITTALRIDEIRIRQQEGYARTAVQLVKQHADDLIQGLGQGIARLVGQDQHVEILPRSYRSPTGPLDIDATVLRPQRQGRPAHEVMVRIGIIRSMPDVRMRSAATSSPNPR